MGIVVLVVCSGEVLVVQCMLTAFPLLCVVCGGRDTGTWAVVWYYNADGAATAVVGTSVWTASSVGVSVPQVRKPRSKC